MGTYSPAHMKTRHYIYRLNPLDDFLLCHHPDTVRSPTAQDSGTDTAVEARLYLRLLVSGGLFLWTEMMSMETEGPFIKVPIECVSQVFRKTRKTVGGARPCARILEKKGYRQEMFHEMFSLLSLFHLSAPPNAMQYRITAELFGI